MPIGWFRVSVSPGFAPYGKPVPNSIWLTSRRPDTRRRRSFIQAPEPVSGFAVTLRNPRFGADTQVRRVIEEARADAELNVRIEARKQRRRFHELLLDHRVSSVYEMGGPSFTDCPQPRCN